jgi:hypothetical protein
MNLKTKLNSVGLSVFKVALTSILCLAGLLSMIYVSLTTKELFSYFYCLATVPFVALPPVLSVLFRRRMNLLFYILFTFYTIGPLLGAVYNFYYFISWWDVLLHMLAGVVFAVVGAQIADVLNKNNKTSYVLSALFGVLLSIAIAVLWEFFEYGSDVFLQSDMQADTVIHAIYTKINRTDGIADVYENITETLVNQKSLGINGYLDIGLIDTMHDMIIETVGAVAFLLYVLVDRNRHPMISDLPKDNHKGKRMEP